MDIDDYAILAGGDFFQLRSNRKTAGGAVFRLITASSWPDARLVTALTIGVHSHRLPFGSTTLTKLIH